MYFEGNTEAIVEFIKAEGNRNLNILVCFLTKRNQDKTNQWTDKITLGNVHN
jgi:hypothetical protein